jgi:hypothetical protein
MFARCWIERRSQETGWPYLSLANFASKDPARADVCFCAPVSSEDNAVIENSKDSITNNDSNTNIKIVNLTLSESLRVHGDMNITCE